MSGSAKAGTTAERHKCELRILVSTVVRAPPKRASGELCFSLTKTYMEVGNPSITDCVRFAPDSLVPAKASSGLQLSDPSPIY